MVEHIMAQIGAEAHRSDGGAAAGDGTADQAHHTQGDEQRTDLEHIGHITFVDAVVDQISHIQGDEDIEQHLQKNKDGREDRILFILPYA